MARVAAQEAPAQRELSLRVIARVRRLTRMFLGQTADADDAVQESLIEILRASGGYRGESSIERWVDRIAIRTAHRVVRSVRRRGALLDDAFSPDDMPTLGKDHEANEMVSDVERHLERLPEARRTVIVLRSVMGYSIEEVSDLTGVSQNTVKDRLLQARREIRRMIRKKHGTAPIGVVHG